MSRYLLALTIVFSLGCASADGHPHPPEEPSPEAQPEPSTEVVPCSLDASYVAWESDGLTHVSHAEGRTAIVEHYEEVPPFDAMYQGVPVHVAGDLSVCLL